MSDNADELLESHKFSPDGSIFAPETLQEVRDRLERIDEYPCHCGTSEHVDALHDLANNDVRVLLKVIEQQTAEVRRMRDDLDFYREWSNDLTQYIPEEFDDDIAQEAIISHWASSVSSEVKQLREAVTAADSILSLLRYRGLVNSENNRRDVAEVSERLARLRRSGR